MIKYSVCVSQQIFATFVSLSIFFNNILQLYFQIVGLPKIFSNIIARLDFRSDYIQELQGKKNSQNQHFWSFLIKETIKQFPNKTFLALKMFIIGGGQLC